MRISTAFSTFVKDLALATGMTLARVTAPHLPEVATAVVMRRLMRDRKHAEIAKLWREDKQRYIITQPLSQLHAGQTVRSSLASIHTRLQNVMLRSEGADGAKVLWLSPLEAAILKERFRELLIEEDVQYTLTRTPLLGKLDPIIVPKSLARTVHIRVQGRNGRPLAGAHVVLFTDVVRGRAYEGISDAKGHVTLAIRKTDRRFTKVIVLPRAGFWSRLWKHVEVASTLVLRVSPLPVGGFDWGHRATEAATVQERYLGRGVKIAIIDSGIAPHRSLDVAGGRNFIVGEAADAWHDDMDGHGTHCAGVIAAVQQEASVWGYVPQASLYALRVFGGADGGGYASDIRDAVKWAMQTECDIISMSLGGSTPSHFLSRAIEDASNAGVLCVAAAGNTSGPVDYPARCGTVVAVTAIGKVGTYPRNSLHGEARSRIRSANRAYFLASFSNRGDEVSFCAPGVAITSTLPPNTFAAWDGTSMACPHIAGIAALALDASPEINKARRDAERTLRLLERVQGLSIDLGMARMYQGAGLPLVSRLLYT
jgi:subtilisin family serine protease